MEARLDGEELALAAEALGEPEGAFDGLGAAVAEEGLLQFAGGDLGELLGQGADAGHVVDVRAGVHELVCLGLGGLEDLGVVVTSVGHRDAGEAVDVLGAVGVVEVRPVTVVGHDRFHPLDEPGHDVVAVLVLDTHVIDHPSEWLLIQKAWVCRRFYQAAPLPGPPLFAEIAERPALGGTRWPDKAGSAR